MNAYMNSVAAVTDHIPASTRMIGSTTEAARAGASGKGFAVIAGEIKALVNQTAEATHEISSKISGVQETASNSVRAIG